MESIPRISVAIILLTVIVTVIVNLRFLQRPQKLNRGNQLIGRLLTRAKSIGSRSRSRESGRQNCQQFALVVMFDLPYSMFYRSRLLYSAAISSTVRLPEVAERSN